MICEIDEFSVMKGVLSGSMENEYLFLMDDPWCSQMIRENIGNED